MTILRFYEKQWMPEPNTGCYIWHGSAAGSKSRRPRIVEGGKPKYVTRIVCEETNGPPPTKRHEAAHKCGLGLCVNGNHLYWATRSQNELDKPKGIRVKASKAGGNGCAAKYWR